MRHITRLLERGLLLALIILLSSSLSSLQAAPTVTVTASSSEAGNPPENAYDGSLSTRWSAMGGGQWIQFTFSEAVIIDNASIAFHSGDQRVAYFSINVSNDGQAWTEVFNGQSSGSSLALETFAFPSVSTSQVRIIGNGNSVSAWNSYTEVQFPIPVEPTCADGVQNQDETGIDCGGTCGGDCCSNGYLDSASGETGVDCGGSCGTCAVGTTYYVSKSDGSDGNDGLSPGSAWQTIAKVNGSDFEPGDAILFKRGDTWREELEITWSGTPSASITFAAYGTGPKPRVLGSETAIDWSNVAGNVWRSGTTLVEPDIGHPASIFFERQDGSTSWGRTLGYSSVPSCSTGFANLQQEYDWCYNGTINVYSPTDPGTRYAAVEVPQRRGSIAMQSHNVQEYIIIDGLELLYGTMYGYNDGWPMNYEKRGLIIRNCHVGYIGIRGGDSAMGLVVWHSDLLVQNNDIHDCGRRSISYNIYTDNSSQPNGLVFENVVFENNTLHNGYHTTGFDISHGDARVSTLRNFIFRNNLIYDVLSDDPINDPTDYTSMGLYLWTGAADFEDFKVYNNVLKNIKQKGFAIGGTTGRHRNLEIYNNVLYGMNPNIDNYRAQATISGNHLNLRFNNNIMHGTVPSNRYPCRGLYYGGNQDGVASLDNNLYFQEDPLQHIINIAFTGGSYHMDDWQQYRSDTGWDGDSPTPQNPLFVDPDNNDFTVQALSPVAGAGKDVGLPFSGSGPSIGLERALGPVGVITD